MEIKYNTPIEVTEKQYRKLMTECAGIVAGRKENGKYYIKVWLMKYAGYVRRSAGF
jgi:hypothetical protein